MTNVVLVGAGKLGSRHLQAISQARLKNLKIFVVDFNPEAITNSKKRLEEVGIKKNTTSIVFLNNINELNITTINLLIIATTSENRFNVLKEISNNFSVINLILEKFLFQKEETYYKAEKLIEDLKIKAWVNCPRRQWKFYIDLKERLKNNKIKKFQVSGGKWSMATSAIHFLDLISFFENKFDFKITNVDFGNRYYPAYSIITGPRENKFIEFFGTIEGEFNNSSKFKFECLDFEETFEILIETDTQEIKIYEELGNTLFLDKNESGKVIDEVNFRMPYQSEITNLILEDIINNCSCSLTSYKESMQLHLPLLKTYLNFLSNLEGNSINKCPIT